MDDLTFEVLRAAVNFARDEQITRLLNLRSKLARMYPHSPDPCDAAILAWSQHVHSGRVGTAS